MDRRGLVISCPIKAEAGGRSLKIDTNLDPQDLRFSLLFWDKLDWPESSLLSFGLSQDAQYLIDIGVLQRSKMPTPTGAFLMEPAFVDGHRRVYRALDRSEPGVWSLGKGVNSIDFDYGDLERDRGISVRLHNVIPVPVKDVPLNEVIEFKEKYRDELLSIRSYLDTIYANIRSSDFSNQMIEREIHLLDLSISKYIKASRASGLAFLSSSFDANLNLPAFVSSSIAAYSLGLSASGALLTGAAAAFSIGPTSSLKRRTESASPFRYISSFHERLF
ncbi:DUF6236 family protein [Xanthobacter sp. V3C-3]|uniref:DUF6236 family protein n=1 Tax=Xanthobacter lutulentifluminis TaxID=3119935 RepID=UPI003726CCCA